MKRSNGGMKRPEGGLKRLGGGLGRMGKPAKVRNPLPEPEVDDPLEGVEIDEEDKGQQVQVITSAALEALKKRRADEQASMDLTTDGAFYFCAIFDTRDQKMAFLRALGLSEQGDIYVDGRKLADKMGIEIPEVKAKMPKLFRVDKRYAEMAMKKGGRS